MGILVVSNCTKIEENNDPVIGIWSNDIQESISAKTEFVRNEWIFNDAYLGRFHQYRNQKLEIISDFKWSKEGDTYIISYPGLKDRNVENALLVGDELKLIDGEMLATRE